MTAHARDDTVIPADAVQYEPFGLPGFHGEMVAALLNVDHTRAPTVALLRMAPGTHIDKHQHPVIAEAVYVLDGEMINDGQVLPAGSITIHGPGIAHGPHRTTTGCTLMFIQSATAGPNDSVVLDT